MFSKMARKSKEIRYEIKQLVLEQEDRNCDIQRLLKIWESAIRSIWKKVISTGNMENMPISGRPQKMTKRAESRLLRLVRKNRQLPLRTILMKEGKYKFRILHENKIFRRVILKKMVVRGEQNEATFVVSCEKMDSWKRLEASHI